MVDAYRSLRARIWSRIANTRGRLHAVAAGVAFVFLAGLSGTSFDDAATPASTDAAVVAADPAARAAAAGSGSRAKPAENPAPAKPAAQKPKPAPKPAPKKVVAPKSAQMHPRKIRVAQQKFTPNADQVRNARAIVDTGKKMGLPPRAWVIAVATALQESTLNNFGNLGARNDHDSLGLFQQRPSAGWGSPKQLQNPTYASTKFYQALVQVPGWDTLPLTVAAQKVQVSAFPNHYAKWEVQAGYLVSAFHGEGPYAKLAARVK